MRRIIAHGAILCGILAVSGCEPGPTEPGGGFQLPPDAQKAQEEASKQTPDQMMEMMKKTGEEGDPTKKK
jgi:hypothetical protein